jgi:hypothetical protein
MFVLVAAPSVFHGNFLPIDAAPAMVTVLGFSWALAVLVERYVSAPSKR